MGVWTGLRGSVLGVAAGIILFFPFICGVCGADQGLVTGPPNQWGLPLNSGEMVFEGRAERGSGIKGSDVKGAAVADAERKALCESVRPMVHPVLFTRERDFILKVLGNRKADILEGAQVVSEDETESGGISLLMTVRMRRDVAEETLLKGLSSRIVLLSSETADGKPLRGYILGSALSSLARRKGCKVVDLTGLNDGWSKSLMTALRAGDREGGKPLYLYLLAGSVMEGRVNASFSEKTGEIYSSRAEGNLRIYRPDKEPVVFAVGGVKGFGSNGPKASIDAVGKASTALSMKAAKSFPGRQKKK